MADYATHQLDLQASMSIYEIIEPLRHDGICVVAQESCDRTRPT